MDKKEISEKLFEKFCSENEVSYSRIPRAKVEGIKTPDYEIAINNRRILVEIKQLVHLGIKGSLVI